MVGLPVAYDYAVGVVEMSRLDEIRERYNHSGKFPRVQQFGHSTALMDIGYLLGLLEVHPASEPPELHMPVLVKIPTPTGDTLYDTMSYDGEWYSVYGKVVSWCKIPPMNVEK